jgi:23S rRNA pseudouridine2457 synthase
MHSYYALHKPRGYLSQFKNNQRRKKPLLQTLFPFPEGTMAVGRLDVKSEGLLLLTTNGKWSNLIRSAYYEKEYWVEIDGQPNQYSLNKLRNGLAISIDGKQFLTKSCKAEFIEQPNVPYIETVTLRGPQHGPTSWLKIILREGKFRQVRKMTAAIGHPTIRLIRTRIGSIHLSPLKAGEAKALSAEEVEQSLSAAE